MAALPPVPSSYVMSLTALEQCQNALCDYVRIPCVSPKGLPYKINSSIAGKTSSLFTEKELLTHVSQNPQDFLLLFNEPMFGQEASGALYAMAKLIMSWTWPVEINSKEFGGKAFQFSGCREAYPINVFDQDNEPDCIRVIIDGKKRHSQTRIYLAKTFAVQRSYWASLTSDVDKRKFLAFTAGHIADPIRDYDRNVKLGKCYCPKVDLTSKDDDMSEWKDLKLGPLHKIARASLETKMSMDHKGGKVEATAKMQMLCMAMPPSRNIYYDFDFTKEPSFIVAVERIVPNQAQLSTFLSIAWIEN